GLGPDEPRCRAARDAADAGDRSPPTGATSPGTPPGPDPLRRRRPVPAGGGRGADTETPPPTRQQVGTSLSSDYERPGGAPSPRAWRFRMTRLGIRLRAAARCPSAQ